MAVILGIIVVASAVTAYSLNALQPKSVPQQEEHNQGEDNSTITITIITTAQVQGAAKQNFETEAERKILGINRSTLWYQEKKLAEVYINVLGGEVNKELLITQGIIIRVDFASVAKLEEQPKYKPS